MSGTERFERSPSPSFSFSRWHSLTFSWPTSCAREKESPSPAPMGNGMQRPVGILSFFLVSSSFVLLLFLLAVRLMGDWHEEVRRSLHRALDELTGRRPVLAAFEPHGRRLLTAPGVEKTRCGRGKSRLVCAVSCPARPLAAPCVSCARWPGAGSGGRRLGVTGTHLSSRHLQLWLPSACPASLASGNLLSGEAGRGPAPWPASGCQLAPSVSPIQANRVTDQLQVSAQQARTF